MIIAIITLVLLIAAVLVQLRSLLDLRRTNRALDKWERDLDR